MTKITNFILDGNSLKPHDVTIIARQMAQVALSNNVLANMKCSRSQLEQLN